MSGGEQKRLALEVVLRSDADVLLLDEPDNYLDVAGKEWLEDSLRACPKTILLISHDRALLACAADKVVTLEGQTAWVHGASFATWHEARDDRLARIDEDHRRWQEERTAPGAVAAGVPPARVDGQRQVRVTRAGDEVEDRAVRGDRADRSRARRRRCRCGWVAIAPGKRVIVCEQLELHGLTDPFDTEIWFGERVAVLGPNGTGKSHFLRLLAGEPVDHGGTWRLGARVVPGYFSQTHDQPELRGVAVLDVVMKAGPDRGRAMAALRRYGLHGCARQSFETLSGGQQARLQILLLELTGANLLLLDEPTDNLDLASAEALEEALDVVRRHGRGGHPRPVVPAHVRPLLRVRPRLLGHRALGARVRVNT